MGVVEALREDADVKFSSRTLTITLLLKGSSAYSLIAIYNDLIGCITPLGTFAFHLQLSPGDLRHRAIIFFPPFTIWSPNIT
jgi:hypothetical protein